jgi:hypothetical protein
MLIPAIGASALFCTSTFSVKESMQVLIETRAKLVASIARGRRWLDEIAAGKLTDVEQIATREKCSVRKVNMTISLAFLAPDLVKAAVEGRLPRGIGVARLCDCPAEWSRQYRNPRPSKSVGRRALLPTARRRTLSRSNLVITITSTTA